MSATTFRGDFLTGKTGRIRLGKTFFDHSTFNRVLGKSCRQGEGCLEHKTNRAMVRCAMWTIDLTTLDAFHPVRDESSSKGIASRTLRDYAAIQSDFDD
jgi:hypothetical protein